MIFVRAYMIPHFCISFNTYSTSTMIILKTLTLVEITVIDV